MKAYFVAAAFHDGQKDKAGEEYILHPMYVSERMTDEPAKVVAMLHDVVEDTPATLGLIEALFGRTISDAVDSLTKRPNEDYEVYIKRIGRDPLATRVKLVDLEHNMMPRFQMNTEADQQRLAKYKKAHDYLSGLSDGLENKVNIIKD